MEKRTITKREHLDMCIQVLAGDAGNPYGDENQRVNRTLEKVDLLLKTLDYVVISD